MSEEIIKEEMTESTENEVSIEKKKMSRRGKILFCILVPIAIVLAAIGIVKIENIVYRNKLNSIFSKVESIGVSMKLSRNGADGYMMLGKNGEAFCSVMNGSTTEVEVYLTNGNCVSFDDSLTTSKCVNPIEMTKLLVNYKASSIEKYKANKITGSNTDKGKTAYVVRINGLREVESALAQCSDVSAEALKSYGAKENSDVSLVISIYRGVSKWNDSTNKSRSIVDDNVEGCMTAQIDLVIDKKAYVIYSLATQHTGEDIKLGNEIYRCTAATSGTWSKEEVEEIINDTVNNISASLGIEEDTEETDNLVQ